ncbi:hypothetical protein [Aliikangiella sp. G2MR2-5]|uniref:hypothetical protein n=1 Tax=Aliikangiella sp. G2MR2-5 TaxID=2788943 RepID=UPI0018AB24B8|nr:hypothetical protein [Aliikangiella sp. G2MR2-5]
MHPSDELLLELSAAQTNFKSSQNAKKEPVCSVVLHIENCHECKARLSRLEDFRGNLKALPEVEPSEQLWLQVSQQFEHFHSEKNLEKQKLVSRNWKITSIALAASLIVALGANIYFIDREDSSNNLNLQIALLIDENQKLQMELSNKKDVDGLQATLVFSQQLRLEEIDSALQKAYLGKFSLEETLILWKERESVLKKMLDQKLIPESRKSKANREVRI